MSRRAAPQKQGDGEFRTQFEPGARMKPHPGRSVRPPERQAKQAGARSMTASNAENSGPAFQTRNCASPDHAVSAKRVATRLIENEQWWARLGSNQRPLRCERSALPLSYAPGIWAVSEFIPNFQEDKENRRRLRVFPAPPVANASPNLRNQTSWACTVSRSSRARPALALQRPAKNQWTDRP